MRGDNILVRRERVRSLERALARELSRGASLG